MLRSSKLAILMMSEINGYQVTKQNVIDAVKATLGIFVLDAKGLYDVLQISSSKALGLTEKTKWNRTAGTQRQFRSTRHELRWCYSDIPWADGMTKKKMSCRILSFLRIPRWKLVTNVYVVKETSADGGVLG